jgi:hypothetical protein
MNLHDIGTSEIDCILAYCRIYFSSSWDWEAHGERIRYRTQTDRVWTAFTDADMDEYRRRSEYWDQRGRQAPR